MFALRESDTKKQRYMQPGETWALPEASFIDFPMRADPTEISYSAQIKTLTLGMRRIVSVSPLKMGEMFSRVFLLDRNFRFTLSGERKASTVDFLTPAYNSVNEYLSMLQAENTFFQGMNQCTVGRGTAHYLTDGAGTSNNELAAIRRMAQQLQSQGLHLYAKTGTIDNSVSKNQSNLLAIIITNGDMRQARIRDGRLFIGDQPLKFYVIYTFMDKTSSAYPSPRGKKRSIQCQSLLRGVNSARFHKFFSAPQQPSTTILQDTSNN